MLNQPRNVFHNLSVAELYKQAIMKEPRNPLTKASQLASNGAIISYSGERTGRVPGDKRIVKDEETGDKIWWGSVNKPISKSSYETLEGFIGSKKVWQSTTSTTENFTSWTATSVGTPTTRSSAECSAPGPTTLFSCTTCSSGLPRSNCKLTSRVSYFHVRRG